jgi:protein-disulfide isomerase
MPKEQQQVSKRQIIREQRVKRQKQQRLTLIGVVIVVALSTTALLVLPSIRNATAPVGTIVDVTPKQWPAGENTTLGEANAPVLVEVWEDFQCPACKTYTEEIEPRIIDDFVVTGKVRYVFRHFPFLDDRAATRESDQSANASMCAMEQGRFWDYKSMLYANWDSENAGAFRDKRLIAFAEKLQLDMTAFNACFEANKYEDQINADLAAGNSAGVTGTPSVFVNGQLLTPGYIPQYEDIAAAINAALPLE